MNGQDRVKVGSLGFMGPLGHQELRWNYKYRVTVSLSQWTELELILQQSAFLFSSLACLQKPRPKPTLCLSRLLISRKENISVEI